ncbi:TOMM system kinase/cyclase fusion protein [Marinomonas shanghaiensis]|uniref:TOMM system kinase/cyclase fusion protein n=1 Tax=Marinomonas shanghaiensis TaxID=2202418 RepID=UPI003A8DED12
MSVVAMQNEFVHLQFDSEEYDLQHKIGQGGFGSVFKAIHKKTKQTVAIKFLQFATQSTQKHRQQQLARFERESNFVCRLSHPHIVRLLDKGSIDDNTLYSVFEYVDGISLSDYLKQHGALGVAETHAIMLQVLDALVHAHQQGIIHRDIKPSNIMILQTGAKHHVKLLDFGISTLTLGQRAEDYKALTITQESIGTPTYCAPEQLRGELTTFSADLYMWGLVFIECLTGAPAIHGASVAEIYHKHLNDIPVPIPAALHSHPLGQLLQRSLRKNASERINSAQALYKELNELIIHNLEGRFLPVTSQNHGLDDTLVLRQDDPNYLAVNTTQATERKQITTLALRIRVKNLGEDTANTDTDTDVVETLFQATRSQCVDVAQRYGGFHVGNLTGFSVFYFGYPVATDHDARLAARTALEIISLTKKQQSYMSARHGCEFELNIGIHTGILLKRGNTVPDGFASHHASDLALQAQGQSILCSLDTKTMLDNYYQFSEQPFSERQSAPQDYTQLIAERAIEAFGFMRGVRNTYPLIGRATELDILRSALENAAHHKIIHLHGEAGIGKSRLIHEFRQLESNRTHHIFQALPEHQNNALFPILSVIKRLLTSLFTQEKIAQKQIAQPQSQGKQLTQLIEQGNLLGPTAEIITLLAAWLNINDIENRQLSSLEPTVQKSLLFEGLAYILNCYQRQTVQPSKSAGHVYIFEDIHWADATTIEFIAHLAKQDKIYGVITTSRQPAPAAFADNPLTHIPLEQLTETATEEFIHTLFEGANIANQVMTLLVARTDGIPLFIEELVSMLKRRQLVQLTKGTIDFVDPQKIDGIPGSLRESIQNKIDGLIYAKDTLQLAAAIGRQFDYNLLVAASHFSELQVQNDVSELIDNQLIIQQRHVDGDRYLFKHALVRDAGYDSIERKTRLELHERIAESILSTTKEIDRFIASDLAQHYEKAQQYHKASTYYYQAASEAETTFAVDDAIHLYQSALHCYRKNASTLHEEGEQKQGQEQQLKAILKGLASCLARDGQHDNARKALQEFIGLLEQANDYETLASAQIALGKTYEVVHQHDDALKHYQSAHVSLLKAPHSDTPEKSDWWKIWLEIKSAILYVHYWLATPSEMSLIIEEIEPIIEKIANKRQLAKYYDDKLHVQFRKKCYSLNQTDIIIAKNAVNAAAKCEDSFLYAHSLFALGFTLMCAGKHEESPSNMLLALKLAEQHQDKVLQTRCCAYLSVNYRLLLDIKTSRIFSEKLLKLSDETNMDDYSAISLANLSWSYFSEGNYSLSSKYLKSSLYKWSNISSRFEFPFLWLSHLQAITLCGFSDDFASKHIHQIPDFSATLLALGQVPLPQAVEQLLLQLSDINNISQRTSLIEKLAKTAAEHRLL